MNITIEESDITNVINESIHDAVSQAIKGYSVQAALSQALASEITSGTIIEAIKEAISRVETDALAQALAREIQRATVKAAVAIVQEGMVDAIAKLRGLSTYSEEDRRERERLHHRIFGNTDQTQRAQSL